MFIKDARRFKGLSRRKFRPLSTKTEFKCRMIKVKLTLFLSFCVGVKFGVLSQEKNTVRVCESRVVGRIFDVGGRWE